MKYAFAAYDIRLICVTDFADIPASNKRYVPHWRGEPEYNILEIEIEYLGEKASKTLTWKCSIL